MAHRHSSVVEAYSVLGLEQDASLEVVKSTYRQLALKTHPDKNPDDADATAQFQKVSEAYNTLVKHLDRSAAPPHSRHNHTNYHPFGYEEDDYDDDEDEDDYYFGDEYNDYESDYESERMDFYMFLFEELLRGRASRFAHAQYQRDHHHHHDAPPETPEHYSARLRKAREEQEQAAERRARDEANRKADQEREREHERREAERRQRVKNSAKKAEAAASRKTAEEKARTRQEQLQALRSSVFAAARQRDAAAVKKGVWEQNVDVIGGEVRQDSKNFVKRPPTDLKETLLHVAAKNGDLALVEWLDSHSADPEERNGDDMTAFHVGLAGGHSKIVKHFFGAYPPEDEDHNAIYRSPESKSNICLALDTKEPEIVWLVLDKHLYDKEEIDAAWETVSSKTFKSSASSPSRYDELVNLFATYGGYSLREEPEPQSKSPPATDPTPLPTTRPPINGHSPHQQNGRHQQSRRPPRPIVTVDSARHNTASPIFAVSENPSPSSSTNSPRSFRGQHFRRGSYRPHQQQVSPSSPAIERGSPSAESTQQDGAPGQPTNGYHGRGRGRGRGQHRGRGRGFAGVSAPSA